MNQRLQCIIVQNLHFASKTSEYYAFEDQGHWVYHEKQGRRTFPG